MNRRRLERTPAPGYPRRAPRRTGGRGPNGGLRRLIAAAGATAAVGLGCLPASTGRGAAEPAAQRAATTRSEPVEAPPATPSHAERESERARPRREAVAGAPASHFPGPLGRGPEPRLSGALSATAIRETVRSALDAFRSCVEGAALSDPPRRAVLRFTIGADGAVVRADTVGPEDAGELGRCFVAVAETLTFPPPGDLVVVSYPFLIRPESPPD